MELALIFAVGWVASHVFGEKRDEYSASQEKHRDKYLAKLDRNHPSWGRARREQYLRNAARRNALGHFAYLMRHGWSSTFNDFGEGWKKAKDAHEEWKNEHPKDGKKPGPWATFKAGWKDHWAKRPKSTGYYEARPELSPKPVQNPEPDPPKNKPAADTDAPADEPEKTGPWLTDDEARNAKVYPWPTASTLGNSAGQTNRSTTVSTEFNFDASQAIFNNIAQVNTGFASQLEQIEADAIAGGMIADKDYMILLSSLQEYIRGAIAQVNALGASANRHASGQEYANSGHAANTDYLRSS